MRKRTLVCGDAARRRRPLNAPKTQNSHASARRREKLKPIRRAATEPRGSLHMIVVGAGVFRAKRVASLLRPPTEAKRKADAPTISSHLIATCPPSPPPRSPPTTARARGGACLLRPIPRDCCRPAKTPPDRALPSPAAPARAPSFPP